MELLPFRRCKSTGKAEPFLFFAETNNLYAMTTATKNCLNGNNSTVQTPTTPTERNTVELSELFHPEFLEFTQQLYPWAKINKLFLSKIKGNAPMVAERKLFATNSPRVCGVSHLRERCCFITILINMTQIKNYFNYLPFSKDRFTGYQLFILAQEGGTP
jgi:hypothetical protein